VSLVHISTDILFHIFLEGYPNIQADIRIPFLRMKKSLNHDAAYSTALSINLNPFHYRPKQDFMAPEG
jgi:hypothetical protein